MSTEGVIRVLCVDDNPDLALLLHKRIDMQQGLHSVGQVLDLRELLGEVQRLEPHVIVLDYKMPGGDPIESMRELQAACPAVRTIVYSGFEHDEPVAEARQAGAWAYVAKRDDIDELVRVIRQVAAGERVFPAF